MEKKKKTKNSTNKNKQKQIEWRIIHVIEKGIIRDLLSAQSTMPLSNHDKSNINYAVLNEFWRRFWTKWMILVCGNQASTGYRRRCLCNQWPHTNEKSIVVFQFFFLSEIHWIPVRCVRYILFFPLRRSEKIELVNSDEQMDFQSIWHFIFWPPRTQNEFDIRQIAVENEPNELAFHFRSSKSFSLCSMN